MNKKKLFFVLFFIFTAILYTVIVLQTGYNIPCFFKKITTLKCPGCGITTMYINIFKFNFRKAFLSNPVIFCLQPLIYYEIIKIIYNYIFEKENKYSKFENFLLYIAIIILISYSILRNF